MPPALLGILDIGKTQTRFFTADPHSGRVLFEAQRRSLAVEGPVVRELDVRGIETWLTNVIEACPHRTRIGTLVPIAHGAAAVLVDEDRSVLVAPDYEDGRYEGVSEEYRLLRDPFELSYSPFLPLGLNLGRQLYYLQRHHASLSGRVRQILLYPQYWAWRFSAVAASEVTSLGCHSDLWRPLQTRPTALAEAQGWSGKLPPMRAAGDVLGTVSAEMARATGLHHECRVLCGLHDSNASFLVHLASRPSESFALVSSGTWTVVMARGIDLARVREPLDMLLNVDAFGSPLATARFMGGREYEIVAGEAGMRVAPAREDVGWIVSNSIFALPSFVNTGGPFASVQGRLVRAHALNARQRATLATLYVALMTDHLLEALDVHGDVIIDGPLARNRLYGEVLAALRPQVRVCVSDDSVSAVSAARYLAQAGSATQHCAVIDSIVPGLKEYREAWIKQIA